MSGDDLPGHPGRRGTGEGDRGGTPPPAGAAGGEEEAVETRPIGTLFLLVIYVMVLAGMWVTIYWLMVIR